MAFNDHKSHFTGKEVADWNADDGISNPQGLVYRIGTDELLKGDSSWEEEFSVFLQDPRSSQLFGLIVGVWGEELFDTEPANVIQALVEARERLPMLKALFIGDVTFEECEVSWIKQGDLSPLLTAYPALEYFGARGGNGLRLGPVRHESLCSLTIETGGLSAEVVRDVMASDFPALEHLELWLGTRDYGATWTLDDLAPLFEDRLFPRLRYLGLCDSDQANELALAISRSPLLERLEVLDLSMGMLGDLGATALLAAPATRKLQKLDIHYNFCTQAMIDQLRELPIELDAAERMDEGGEYQYYVAVSE